MTLFYEDELAEQRAAAEAHAVKIVYNKLLGGWYVVRGRYHTPLNGRFDTKADAQAWLNRRNDR